MSNLERDCVHVVCSSDENYVLPLAVMLTSLVANLKKYEKARIFVLEANISPNSKERILKSVKRDGVDIQFIKLDISTLRTMKVDGHISLAAYHRLLVELALPRDLDKVIYLDCDLVVHGDVGGLWDVPIGDKAVLAAQEQGEDAAYVSSSSGLSNYRELGLRGNQKYFNSGVLVINLALWREEQIGMAAIRYAEQNKQHIRCWDQDALNATLANRWGELDPRWNLLTQVFSNSPWNAGPIKDRTTFENLINHPHIVHFNTSSKPWLVDIAHPYKNLFFHYLDQTDWIGWRPKREFRHWAKKLVKRVMKFGSSRNRAGDFEPRWPPQTPPPGAGSHRGTHLD